MKRIILFTIVAMDLALATNPASVSPVSNKQKPQLVQLTQGPTKRGGLDELEGGRRGLQSLFKDDNERKTPPVLIAPSGRSGGCKAQSLQDWIHQLKVMLSWL